MRNLTMSKKLLGNFLGKGLLFVVSAPAGTGKSTLVDMLLQEFPNEIAESCSCTTRTPRPGEILKKHYDFLTIQEFEKKIDNDEFLEYVKVYGNYYGTLKEEVHSLQSSGKHVVLVIDTQGALQLMKTVPAVFIFITPPSLEELRRRLFKRQTEDKAKIEERIQWAENEIKHAEKYDYQIVNDDLMITYTILKSIFIAEEHKVKLTKA